MKYFEFRSSNKIRLDSFLQEQLPLKLVKENIIENSISNSKIRRLIVAGAVSVNKTVVVRPAFELRGNSIVSVSFDEEKFFFEKKPDDIHFEMSDSDVLFENEDLIFVNKPSLFPVEQTITGNRSNLHDAVVDYLWKRNPELRNPPYVGIMHRLDRETSGVILFTKNRGINKSVSQMFQSHDFTKEYVAVVKNNSAYEPGKKFTVEMFMGRISGKSQAGKWGRVPEKKGGQYSKTDFLVLGDFSYKGKQCLLVKCFLYTGRTHQIRVHLSEKGLPLLGDELYGGDRAERIFLHAERLACNNEELKFDVFAPIKW